MSSSFVSRKRLILEIKGKEKIPCELKRHLSPRTVGAIMRSLPIEGNAHKLGQSIAYFETSIDSGVERPRKKFTRGDIAFFPVSGNICFFIIAADTGKNMTPIGRILENVEALKSIKSGDILRLYEETG